MTAPSSFKTAGGTTGEKTELTGSPTKTAQFPLVQFSFSNKTTTISAIINTIPWGGTPPWKAATITRVWEKQPIFSVRKKMNFLRLLRFIRRTQVQPIPFRSTRRCRGKIRKTERWSADRTEASSMPAIIRLSSNSQPFFTPIPSSASLSNLIIRNTRIPFL